MTTYEIPLRPQSQTLSITLAGATYSLAVTWRDAPANGWFLDIADANGAPILGGLAMVPGADLFGQFRALGLGFSLYVQSDGDPDAAPTYAGLGITAHLFAVW